MGQQFLRSYEMSITPPGEDTRIIKDLRISFEITKSTISTPNTMNLKIWNANSDTLAALQKRFTLVQLNVGYAGNLKLLFSGALRNVFQSRVGTESIIEVYAGDGQQDWQNASFSKTFEANVGIRKIVEEVMGTMSQLTIGPLEGVPTEADKLLGQTISGSSKDVLDQYAADYGFTWSIQDGELVTTPNDEPLSTLETVLISAATGMIGSPTITQIGADVVTLLDPRLIPNTPFQIESVSQDVQLGNLFFRGSDVTRTVAEGRYNIRETVFVGDSWDGEWLSKVKGQIIL